MLAPHIKLLPPLRVALAFCLMLFTQSVTLAQRLTIDYVGTERAYSTAETNVVLLGIVRNTGDTDLPANLYRVRCYPLSGLDYTFGETMPTLPALKPGESVACRWTLMAKGETVPTVVAVLLESLDPAQKISPQTRTAVLPRVPMNQPLILTAPVTQTPLKPVPPSATKPGLPPAHPDRVQVQVVQNEDGVAAILIAAREGEGWNAPATLFPLMSVKSANSGQLTWEEGFHIADTNVTRDANSTTVTLLGSVGARWSAELELTLRRDTAVVEGKLRLTAKRNTRLSEINLPTLLTPSNAGNTRADGVPQLVTMPTAEANAPTLRAERVGNTFVGIALPEASPYTGFILETRRTGVLAPILLTKYRAETPFVVAAGTKLVIPFRVFTISTAAGVTDAKRFALP